MGNTDTKPALTPTCPAPRFFPEIVLRLPDDLVIVAVYYAPEKRVQIVRNKRVAVGHLFTLPTTPLARPAYPPTLFANTRGHTAMECKPDPDTICKILCNLCTDAESIEVCDSFAGSPARYTPKSSDCMVCDVHQRVTAMVNVNYSLTSLIRAL